MKIIVNGQSVDIGGGSSGGSAIETSFPSGGIIIWSGASNNIPDGWALCDGTNGTPDLRGRFVLGESETHAVGSTGGEEEVTLTVEQMPEHTHRIYMYPESGTAVTPARPIIQKGPSGVNTSYTQTTNSAGFSQPHPNMPPYYVLCYIMKL